MENLQISMTYCLFGLMAHDYNKNREGGETLQQIFIKNWKNDIRENMMGPELKRIGKELSNPAMVFDSVITETDTLGYEEFLQFWAQSIKEVENHFLEATGDGRDLENEED